MAAAVLVAVPLAVLVGLGWARGDPAFDGSALALEIERRGELLSLAVRVRQTARVTLIAGQPWSPEKGVDPLRPASRIALDPGERPTLLLAGPCPEGETVRLELPTELLVHCPDPCVLQCVAMPEGGAGEVSISNAWVVSRSGGLRVEPFSRELLCGQIRGLALWAWLPAVFLVITMMSSWPRRWPRWAGLALLLAAALGVLVLRGATADPRESVELGARSPPLTWPGTWSLTEDRWIALHGPAIRQLSTTARAAREDAEALTIWTDDTDGPHFHLSMGLAQLLPEARVRRRTPSAKPVGLVILVGGEPVGEVLLATPRGTLARVGK